MATMAQSMPQSSLLTTLIVFPMHKMLSAGVTPRESMPRFVQDEMLRAPTTHFVSASQVSLFRGGY